MKTAELIKTALAPCKDAVELIRYVYGDSNGLKTRSLDFKSETITDFEQFKAMVRVIDRYNAFDAEAVIEALKSIWPALMSVQIAREGSPALYFKLPYWTGQMIGAPNEAGSVRLAEGEIKLIELELREALRDLEADEIDLQYGYVLRAWWD